VRAADAASRHQYPADDQRQFWRYGDVRPSARHERAARVLPGGVNRNIVHHAPCRCSSSPAAAPKIATDVDSSDYLDFIGNHTAMIVGAAHRGDGGGQRQLARGTGPRRREPEAELAS
jgi:hypothetical protein